MAEQNLEVEVKFFIEDLPALRKNLLAAGAVLHKERVFERNIRFDTPDDALMKRLELLRLREDTAVRVTFKGPAPEDVQSEAKVRQEFEMGVDDFETAVVIFQRLGYRPKQTYEKYRETFLLRDVEIVLDELPFGDFVELEGAEKDIKAAAFILGLDWRKRILINYLGLMAQLKSFHNLPFNDLTFNNFKGIAISVADIIR